MLNKKIYNVNEDKDITMNNSMKKNIENESIKKEISTFVEMEPAKNIYATPQNITVADQPDEKVPEKKLGGYQDGELIRFSVPNPYIQKHVLTINQNDVVTVGVGQYYIWVNIEDGDFIFDKNHVRDMHTIRRTKKGYIFRQRMVYKDAVRMLKRIGYKKDCEHIRLCKRNNKVKGFYVSEEWYHEKHDIICDYLSSIVNINQTD